MDKESQRLSSTEKNHTHEWTLMRLPINNQDSLYHSVQMFLSYVHNNEISTLELRNELIKLFTQLSCNI